MIFKQLALLGLLAEAKKSFSNPEFRQKFEKRLLQKTQEQNSGTRSNSDARGFLSAITAFSYCGEFNSNAQFEILSDYLIENNGKKVFYSHFGKFKSFYVGTYFHIVRFVLSSLGAR